MAWLSWLPDLAALQTWLLGLLVAPVFVIGIPLLMAVTRLPRRLVIEPVPEGALTPAQARWLGGVDEKLRPFGFETVETFRVPNLPHANLGRLYRSTVDATVATAMALRAENEQAVLSANPVELVTEFADGSMVATRSAAVDELFDLLPGYELNVHRETDDPAELRRLHERHCEQHLVKQPVYTPPAAVLPKFCAFHERWGAHQVARGLLRVRDENDYGATFKLALRGVLSYFNPFGDRFTVLRLLLGVLVGLAPPMLAALAVAGPAAPWLRGLEVGLGWGPAAPELLVLGAALLASAAAVGWVFESRAVVWSPILACVAGLLVVPETVPEPGLRAAWAGVLLATPVVANALSNFRHRLQSVA